MATAVTTTAQAAAIVARDSSIVESGMLALLAAMLVVIIGAYLVFGRSEDESDVRRRIRERQERKREMDENRSTTKGNL